MHELCTIHGGGDRCRSEVQKGDLRSNNCDIRQPGSRASSEDSMHIDLTAEECKDTSIGASANEAASAAKAAAVLCHIDGCTTVAEKSDKNGMCQFHAVKPRCNNIGCLNFAHYNSALCLMHLSSDTKDLTDN
ncbi:hypothetical protein PPTG_01418 [Phytophthora nicotianae INRA-310]|uniref:Uncharacterized protein n=1 Tax=Phytophthora nicotianae (strain INRA-310) TaxID=761204 RepID=W2R9C6_PHYN3|nr:hypothetical protein PPTG_01418 [Phytophthora nicotianae INRA-310]ETN21140.1 hypothetical protein PPTG_01418 [Phytophthora nicotianae INRA-310]